MCLSLWHGSLSGNGRNPFVGIPKSWTSGYELDFLGQPLKVKTGIFVSMITYGWSSFEKR